MANDYVNCSIVTNGNSEEFNDQKNKSETVQKYQTLRKELKQMY